MKKIFLIFGIALTLVFLSEISGAQGRMSWKGSAGWGPGSQYNRMFDPKTVETLSGAVVNVNRITPARGMASGVHLMLKTEKETISVHLGPSWFIENQDTKIEEKDTIEIKGSRINFDGKPAIIAAEVIKGDQRLKLRDENGIPLWSGWRQKRPGVSQ